VGKIWKVTKYVGKHVASWDSSKPTMLEEGRDAVKRGVANKVEKVTQPLRNVKDKHNEGKNPCPACGKMVKGKPGIACSTKCAKIAAKGMD
jgi:hypothetical protein